MRAAGLLVLLLCLSILAVAAPAEAADDLAAAAEREAAFFRTFGGQAYKVGETTMVLLRSGAEHPVTGNTDCDDVKDPLTDCARLLVQNYVAARGYYVFYVALQEGHRYALVDDTSGTETLIADMPRFSPDGKRFAAVSTACNRLGSLNGVEIWRLDSDGLVKELWWEPRAYGEYRFERWEGRNGIALSYRSCQGDDPPWTPAQAMGGPKGWIVLHAATR